MRLKMAMIVSATLGLAGSSLVSCKSTSSNASVKSGLSAESSADNVAMLIAANRDAAAISADLPIIKKILQDPAGNYHFNHINQQTFSTQAQILNDIATSAAQVSADGTLFLYFTGHGNQVGQIWTQDGGFVGFNDVIGAIDGARQTPFRRIVIMVASCFSGSWLTSATINKSDMARELLIITSASAGQYSQFDGSGTKLANAFAAAFNTAKVAPNATLASLVAGLQGYGGWMGSSPLYRAIPTSIMSESLVNTGATPPAADPQTPAPTSTATAGSTDQCRCVHIVSQNSCGLMKGDKWVADSAVQIVTGTTPPSCTPDFCTQFLASDVQKSCAAGLADGDYTFPE